MNPDKPNMRQRVALFQAITYPGQPSAWNQPVRYGTDELKGDDWRPSDYIRISEWITIDFAPVPMGDLVAAQTADLTKERDELIAEFNRKVGAINNRLSQLQAITYEPAKVDVSSIRLCQVDECEDYAEPGERYCVTHGDER